MKIALTDASAGYFLLYRRNQVGIFSNYDLKFAFCQGSCQSIESFSAYRACLREYRGSHCSIFDAMIMRIKFYVRCERDDKDEPLVVFSDDQNWPFK